jgi:hypothetical protein
LSQPFLSSELPTVGHEVARVEENAFVGRANDEALASLEIPASHDVAGDRHAERSALAANEDREADDEPGAFGSSEERYGDDLAHVWMMLRRGLGGVIMALPAKSDFVRL